MSDYMRSEALERTKQNLGLTLYSKDNQLLNIIDSLAAEFSAKGIKFDDLTDTQQIEYLGYISDYAAWRYRSNGVEEEPRYLKYRRHNIVIGAW